MEIRSSLKRKSILALIVYLCFFLATIGSLTYLAVDSPFRKELKQYLDVRAELLSSQVLDPLNRSVGVLQSIVSIAQASENQQEASRMLRSIFSTVDDIVISGGIWPKPFSVDSNIKYSGLFFNRALDGQIDQLHSWNNPEAGGYDSEVWYVSGMEEPSGSVFWSPVYVDSFTQIQMITVTSPYYVNGEFAGVVTVDLSLQSLTALISRHAERYDLGVSLRDSYGSTITEHNFRLRDGAYVSKYTFGDFDWKLDVVNSRRLVDEDVFDLVMSVEKGIIPFLLFCLMFGYYLLSRYLINPIALIAQKVEESKEGGIIEIPYRSHDEIRYLIDTFNQKTVYLEAEKVKAQASTKSKSIFLATLSHEIRTPMNGVLGMAQILLRGDLKPQQRKQLKSLYESGEHMMALLNEMLDFSKFEQGHMELDYSKFPLEFIIGSVTSVYSSLCHEKGLQFKVYSEVPANRWYFSDKARIRQILFNLLNNAVKFTSRGLVEVFFSEVKLDGQLYLSIRVRDTGIGIEQAAQEKIFRPFEQAESSTTRRFGGTGLGLAIVKQIAELMDGTVSVNSQLDIGTSFQVNLKIDVCDPETHENNPARHLSYSGLKVLIVEDNRTNTMIIETFMKNKGFECECVENGDLAIQAVANGQFDLVLMDNHMPVKDGVEAIQAIRHLESCQSKVLILGCTADVFKETREGLMNAGADAIVAKPINEIELDDALYSHINKLYQYHSKMPKLDFSGATEEMLVKFYIAIENKALGEALDIIEILENSLALPDESQLASALKTVKSHLEGGELPPKSAIDLLTVLLSDY
ncbi:hybrid sensor histidine kinase/response regulator [Vibrio ziniensis]|uniref:histidine kinase n=1 Tax=Vibrio ziniensis TaxID=2711221 RepID=A0A6G7CH25_9VIBR|nr:hybrid sensor histidine kinase/response regulator [Vibrio ziniensis]QIH41380.1 response regulator [Vibrio ziniensis]